LSNRDPFLAPMEKKREADEIKDSWSPVAFRSDPLAIWAAYNEWVQFDDAGLYYKGNQFCSLNFLSKPTLLNIKQVKGSLLQNLDQAGVIAVSAGGNVRRIGRRTVVPKELNTNGGSLPLLAALLAMASAPNFALRTSEKTCRTAQDKVIQFPSIRRPTKLIIRQHSSTPHPSIRENEKRVDPNLHLPHSTQPRNDYTPLAKRPGVYPLVRLVLAVRPISAKSPDSIQ